MPRHPSSSWTNMPSRCRMGSSAQQAPAPLPPSPLPPSHRWRTRSRYSHSPSPCLQPSMPHPTLPALTLVSNETNTCKPSSQVSSCHSLSVCGLVSSLLPLSVSLHISVYHPFMCVVVLQAADRGLTPPPPPGLARPSSTASPSSRTIGSTESHASVSSGMPTANSQARQQPQGTRGSAPALAPAAKGGFGSGLKPDMLRRLGNGV